MSDNVETSSSAKIISSVINEPLTPSPILIERQHEGLSLCPIEKNLPHYILAHKFSRVPAKENVLYR